MGSRGRSGSSTPPTALNRRRMESVRLDGPVFSAVSAALSISRASCSIDRPRLAARMRKRVFVDASSRRMVMLAMPSMLSQIRMIAIAPSLRFAQNLFLQFPDIAEISQNVIMQHHLKLIDSYLAVISKLRENSHENIIQTWTSCNRNVFRLSWRHIFHYGGDGRIPPAHKIRFRTSRGRDSGIL